MDVLIGLDSADLHFSFKDIHGAPGQPVAHRIPLGWTYIGAMDDNKQTKLSNNFACTFFSVDQTDTEKVNLMLQKFREVDTSGTEEVSILKAEDNLVLNMTETHTTMVVIELLFLGRKNLLTYQTITRWQRRDYTTWRSDCLENQKLLKSTNLNL